MAKKPEEQARKKRWENDPEYREKVQNYRRAWRIRYKQDDPKRRLSSLMSREIRLAIEQRKGGRRWEDLVGYTLGELMDHLESKFTEGMTWDNMGKWRIDHVRPISSFNFETVDDPDFKKCWSLENLQPLWGGQNLGKGAKYNPL